MIPVQRHQHILALIAEHGVISINELIERLGVSHMTIRRDIHKLEQQGALLTVSGGVRSTGRLETEPSHQDKTTMFSEEKAQIGRAALRYIPRNSTLYLDAGTTTLALARELSGREDLLVVTNDFVIASFIIESTRCRMIHTGGTLCRENRSCVGEAAARALQNLSVDIAFISSSCWGTRGIFTPDENKVLVKRAVAAASSKRILLSDSSKYNKHATFLALPLEQFDTLITDASLPSEARKTLSSAALELVIAG